MPPLSVNFSESLYLEDVSSFAKQLAPTLRGGEVFGLSGNLGAGKTFFVQELLKTLGVTTPVTSPTYNIAKSYSATLPKNGLKVTIWHLDIYRINSSKEVLDMGIFDANGPAFDPENILLVEWPEKALDLFDGDVKFFQFLGLRGDV